MWTVIPVKEPSVHKTDALALARQLMNFMLPMRNKASVLILWNSRQFLR